MDQFEFILVITSVIFALGITAILSGISRFAQSSAEIRTFLPHSIWVLNLFIFIILVWWVSWEFRGVDWTFPRYAYMLVAPTLLYFACSLLMPQQFDGEAFSLEEHFFRVRRPLFASFFLTTVIVMIDGDVMGDDPIWHSGRVGNLAMLGLAVWGYLSTGRNAHRVVAGLTLLVFVGLIVLRFWNPR